MHAHCTHANEIQSNVFRKLILKQNYEKRFMKSKLDKMLVGIIFFEVLMFFLFV